MSNSSTLQHVAVIMDGNRRWAKRQKLPAISGHNEGLNALKRIVPHFIAKDIPYVTLFCFSSENWKRSGAEVQYLMRLLEKFLTTEEAFLQQHNIKVSFIGDRSMLKPNITSLMERIEQATQHNTATHLALAVNYGAMQEILQAAQKLAQESTNIQDITQLNRYLYAPSFPPVDLLIRTGGEKRLSNFLLWQSAYAELIFDDILFPDIQQHDIDNMIQEFYTRVRRFGGDDA